MTLSRLQDAISFILKAQFLQIALISLVFDVKWIFEDRGREKGEEGERECVCVYFINKSC